MRVHGYASGGAMLALQCTRMQLPRAMGCATADAQRAAYNAQHARCVYSQRTRCSVQYATCTMRSGAPHAAGSRHHAAGTSVDTTRRPICRTGWTACMPTNPHNIPHTDTTQRTEHTTYSMAPHASRTVAYPKWGMHPAADTAYIAPANHRAPHPHAARTAHRTM